MMSGFEAALVCIPVLSHLELHSEVRLCSIKQNRSADLMARDYDIVGQISEAPV